MGLYKHKILILGGSGFIGHTIYRELCRYYETYGTYCTKVATYKNNKAYFYYDVAEPTGVTEILKTVQPSVIISALKGNYQQQIATHKELITYITNHHHSRLFYLSSDAVFDAKFEFPSIENERPASKSALGKFKITAEKLLLEAIPAQVAILRLPLVLGVTSPVITQLRHAIKNHSIFDVYPNRIITVTTADKIAQQIHYLINKNEEGIFHLASKDVIHHRDLFIEICEKTGYQFPIFKSVYDYNEDNYAAILSKLNILPENYQITVAQVIDDCTLSEDILTLRS